MYPFADLGKFEGMEQGFSQRAAEVDRLLSQHDTAFVLVCAAIALWALRRYLYLLMHAEEMANQANCGQCQAYGLLRVPEETRPDSRQMVPVCCKRCGFRWNLQDG